MNFEMDQEDQADTPKRSKRVLRQPVPGEEAPTLAQVKLIIKECKDKGLRKHAMLVSVGWNLALRLNELSGLRVGDFDFVKGLVRVRKEFAKKATKDRYIVMNEFSFTTDVQDYIKERRLEEKNFLFCHGDEWKRYSNRRLAYMIEEAGDLIGFEGLHPHLLRHSRAKWLIENGYNMKFVQRLLRHKKAATTQDRYTEFSQDELIRQGQEGAKAKWDDVV